MSLTQALITRIATGGPLKVADYMHTCTAQYYGSRDPFGAQGDFTTAPEVSQIFGELIGAWLAQSWVQLGSPAKAILCEMGPGRGTLMQDALRATARIAGFHGALDVVMIETSPYLKKHQQKRLKDAHPRISWKKSFDKLSPAPLLLVANELFDALPIHQHLRVDGTWQERHVDVHDGRLVFTPAGKVITESSPESLNLAAHIATHIHAHAGAALIIDYGYTGGSQGDTLQALQNHTPIDVLAAPGESDITAHVDFDSLLHTIKGRGAHAWGPVAQGTFLKRLGAELRATALCKNATQAQQKELLSGLERLIAPHEMGELFKVAGMTSFVDKPAGF